MCPGMVERASSIRSDGVIFTQLNLMLITRSKPIIASNCVKHTNTILLRALQLQFRATSAVN